jgi:phage-related protein
MREFLKSVCHVVFGAPKKVLEVLGITVEQFLNAVALVIESGDTIVCSVIDQVFDVIDDLRGLFANK